MEISVFGRKRHLITFYNHIIMHLDFDKIKNQNCSDFLLHKVTPDNVNLLDGGNYSINPMRWECKLDKIEGYYMSSKDEPDKCLSYCWVTFPKYNQKHYRIENVESYLFKVCTLPECRGKGYCGKLVSMVFQELLKRNIHSMELAVMKKNKNAIKAYEKLGFKKIGRKFFVRFLRYNIPYHTL